MRPPDRWTTRALLAFWLPLALSWTMMAVAQPVVAAGISRLEEPAVHLAAAGVMLDLAVLIESPIIMLFAASIALTRDQASYRLLRRFMLVFAGGLLALFAAVAFTPLADLVLLRVIGVPDGVAAQARAALRWLLPWVPAIAWRRFYQGPLLSAGMPRLISYGTACRLAVLAAAVVLGTAAGLPGATMGAVALSASVVIEALVITAWALPVVRRLPPGELGTLAMPGIVQFYLPLAATDLMRVLSRPLTTAGIARAAAPALSLAAWPVAHGLATLVGSAVMAFQEMVVALGETEAGYRRVARFVTQTGIAVSGVLGLLAFTPLVDVYVIRVVHLPEPLQPGAVTALRVMIALPLLLALRNLFRGALIGRRHTARVQQAMAGNLAALAVVIAAGVAAQVPGVLLAAWATVIAQAAEVLLLLTSLYGARRAAAAVPEPTAR